MFRKICQRNTVFLLLSLLSLILLLLLIIIHHTRLISHYSNLYPLNEDNPVINHNRKLETVHETTLTTVHSDWNVNEWKMGERGVKLNQLTRDDQYSNISTTSSDHSIQSETQRNSLIKKEEVIDVANRGAKKTGIAIPVVWRGVEFGSEARKLRKMFPLPKNFTFPNSQITLPLSEIDRSKWILSLRKLLAARAGSKVINFVSSNSQYQDVLLNWLISAVVRSNIELGSILVLSMDLSLHLRLTGKGIPSISVPLYKLIHRDTNFTKPFDQVMMLRLAIMRLVSFWGFDIHNYDTDAVLLKDPQPLYDRYPTVGIIGSVGRIPFDLMDKWGITVCIGVVIIRSSPLIEEYWQSVTNSCPKSLDDQQKLNCGLDGLNITWANPNSNQNTTVVSGHCSNGLEVKVLPYYEICRLETCAPSLRDSLYIWHKGGHRTRKEKVKGSRAGRTWFLQYRWSVIKNQLLGKEWLESISYWQITHT